MKKHITQGILFTAFLLSLSACSSDSSSWDKSGSSMGFSSSDSSYAESAPQDSNQAQLAQSAVMENVKLVYTGSVSLETLDFVQAKEAISALVLENDGYFAFQEDSHTGSYGFSYYTIRIPSGKYYSFIDTLGETCHLTNTSTSVEDISVEYYDSQGRLETQLLKMERLQEMILQAETMEDLITLESAISETQWQIDSLSGKMREYDSLVDYATLEVTLREMSTLSNVQPEPHTLPDRLATGLKEGTENFVDTVENTLVSIAYHWIAWAIALGTFVLIRKRWKKKPFQLNRTLKQDKNTPDT